MLALLAFPCRAQEGTEQPDPDSPEAEQSLATSDISGAPAEPDTTGQPPAGGADEAPAPAVEAETVPEPTLEERREAACPDPTRPRYGWLEQTHRMVYHGVCGAGVWLDHFMAGTEIDESPTYGRLALGANWDQRDGLDPLLRLRARVPLPSFKNKLRLLVGRGNERSMVEDRDEWAGKPIPADFGDVDDSSWLLGLGYGKDTRLENGWEFNAGVHVRRHPDAVLKTVYRHDFPFHDDSVTRFRQTFFWRATDGFGETTSVNFDHLVNHHFMVRWANSGTVSEEEAGLDWDSTVSLYQDLSQQRAMVYSVLARGLTEADVPLQDYGFEVKYRTRFLRDWLFLEVSSSVTWPREELTEDREANFGAGARVEMYFGPVPPDDLR